MRYNRRKKTRDIFRRSSWSDRKEKVGRFLSCRLLKRLSLFYILFKLILLKPPPSFFFFFLFGFFSFLFYPLFVFFKDEMDTAKWLLIGIRPSENFVSIFCWNSQSQSFEMIEFFYQPFEAGNQKFQNAIPDALKNNLLCKPKPSPRNPSFLSQTETQKFQDFRIFLSHLSFHHKYPSTPHLLSPSCFPFGRSLFPSFVLLVSFFDSSWILRMLKLFPQTRRNEWKEMTDREKKIPAP